MPSSLMRSLILNLLLLSTKSEKKAEQAKSAIYNPVHVFIPTFNSDLISERSTVHVVPFYFFYLHTVDVNELNCIKKKLRLNISSLGV